MTGRLKITITCNNISKSMDFRPGKSQLFTRIFPSMKTIETHIWRASAAIKFEGENWESVFHKLIKLIVIEVKVKFMEVEIPIRLLVYSSALFRCCVCVCCEVKKTRQKHMVRQEFPIFFDSLSFPTHVFELWTLNIVTSPRWWNYRKMNEKRSDKLLLR